MTRKAERKRLVGLAKKAIDYCNTTDCGYCGLGKFGGFPGCKHKRLADIILADGWIRQPIKMGQTVYRLIKMRTGITSKSRAIHRKGMVTGIIQPCEPTIKQFIRCITVTKNNFIDCCDNFGKTVFLTREEAEKALRKEDENGKATM